MPIRLLLADDHPVVLRGIEDLFRHEGGFVVVATCTDTAQTLRAVREHRPDVLVLDLRMPTAGGLEVLRQVKAEMRCRVVVLTAAVDEKEVIEAVRLGAEGVILKEMAPRLLVECVTKVHAGERWLEKRSTGQLLEKLLRRERGLQEVVGRVTPRELEIVRLVANGLQNKEIATSLGLTEGTVKLHLHNIYQKLGVSNRVSLTLMAQDKGLV